ncbi:MAG: hypothetical protein ACREYA_27080 [Cupriavidus necator]
MPGSNRIDRPGPAAFRRGRPARVYPGFLQVCAFLSMNPARHMGALLDGYQYRMRGETAKAEASAFYVEWTCRPSSISTSSAGCPSRLPPRGQLTVSGRRVDPRAIRRTALLTVEGELDDICAVGQTAAAHDLCSCLPAYRKHHYVQTGVGHYGVFAGRRWATQIYPIVREVIHASEPRHHGAEA